MRDFSGKNVRESYASSKRRRLRFDRQPGGLPGLPAADQRARFRPSGFL